MSRTSLRFTSVHTPHKRQGNMQPRRCRQAFVPCPCSDLCDLFANAVEGLGNLLLQALLHVAARLQGQRAILGLLDEFIHLQ